MKINTLLEYTSPSSQPNQAGGQAPKFGRDPNVLETTTGSGSVATVSNPVGGMQRRNSKGSMFQGIKTSKKFVNSPVTEDEISEEQLLVRQIRKELFNKAKNHDIGNRPKDYGIMAKESDPEYDDEAGMTTTNLHTALRAVEGLNKVIGPNENLPEWVQEKIAIANDYLVTCWDYMISQHEQGRKYEVDENQDWMKDIAAMAHKMAPQDKMRQRQAERDAQAQAERQQRIQQDIENLPDLISQYNDMEAEYESMGGSNWQYADREQNLSDEERKARGMETSMRHLANRIHAAKKASEGLEEAKPDFAKMFNKKIGKHNAAVVKTKKEIGTRVADIGAGGKEYNVKTDKEWDKQKGVTEVAPPGAKAERMVKHIKKSYSKDGKITPKEKSIAYATAWKAHNKGSVEEGSEAQDNLVSILNSFDYYSDNGKVYVNDAGDKIARQGSNWKHQSGKVGHGSEELGNFLRSTQGVAEGLPQTLRKVVPGYAKREIDKKMDAEKFGRTDVDRDANYYRYKKIQDKIKDKGVAEGIFGDRTFNRVMPMVKRIASEVSDYDRDEFGEELWSLLDQKYGSKFAQSVLQDDLDFYWNEYTDLTGQGVAEGLNEFAPPGSGDNGNDGFSDDTLKRLAAQWYNGDEDPRVEQTLAAAGWEIGQDEGYDDEPGVFVVQAGDVNGNSYISWPAHELKQGVAEEQLDEACWKGYHKEGMKTMFGKRYPNCVKNKNESLETYIHKGECPGCGGTMVAEGQLNEKQDACYHKVKSRYKVWPSAYASGALVQCRKKGAANWGNSNESITQEEYDQLDENLKKWFSDKWVRFGPDGKIRGDCARGDDSEGKPKCLPQSKAHSLGKKGRATAASRKRREDPNPERSGRAINVNTKKKS